MGPRLRTIVLVLVGACRPTGPSTPPGAAAVPDAAQSTPPPFLALDADLDALHPLRVRMIRAGALRLEREAPPVNDPENRNVAVEARLLEPDEYGRPSVPRILCEGESHRVAIYVERDDLAWAIARTTQLFATSPNANAGPLPPQTPGLELRAGTTVRVEGDPDGDIVRVRYERPGVRVAGYVAGDDVGIAWTRDTTELAPQIPDAKLVATTSFASAPGGQSLGEIDPRMAVGIAAVKTMGADRGGHTLVRWDNGELALVGWVPTAAIERGPQAMGSLRMTGRGAGPPEGADVKLARGTVLRGGPLRRAVGVVTKDAELRCVGECDGEHPRVAVAACSDVLELVADGSAP